MDVGLGQHGVVLELRLVIVSQSSPDRRVWTHTLRRGGVLPAMITSLAFPERRVLRVDL